ncbi:hypothetical protein H9Q69_012999 [Fusarium xylarioides]|nr:hypothetical protein H9Q69_012999 [Fusarium xylarioides]
MFQLMMNLSLCYDSLCRIAAGGVLVALFFGILRLLEYIVCNTHGKEPQPVYSRIPFIGHELSLVRHGVSFHERLQVSSGLPIATIFLGLQKVYIVNSPELVSHVNRAPKAMNTALPFLVVVCGKLCGMGRDDLETLMKNPTVRGSLWRDLQECIHAHLDAGSSSGKEITTRVANELWKELVEGLMQCIHKHSMGTQFAARFFLGLVSGFVINTVPAAFWLIGHISDDEQLKAIIREELNQVVTSDTCGSLTVSPEAVRGRCPYLMSTCHEVLRFISSSTSTFFIHQDTYLNNRYLLKKGAILQVASTAIHSNTDIWGPAAQAFKPDRFVKPEKVHPSANRTFGGGITLCPGRQLAMNELILTVAMIFHTFDVEFSPETPRLPAPMVTDMLSVKKPMTDLKIRMSRRPGMEHVSWVVREP